MTTDLYSLTQRRVKEFEIKINRELDPWRMFNAANGITTKDYYGKPINIRGIKFTGQEIIYHKFIEPFIENGIVRILDETLDECKSNNLAPDIYLEEAVDLLKALVKRIYTEVIKIEFRLKEGGGWPHGLPDQIALDMAKGKIDNMEIVISEHLKGLQLKTPNVDYVKKFQDWFKNNKLFAILIIIFGGLLLVASVITAIVAIRDFYNSF